MKIRLYKHRVFKAEGNGGCDYIEFLDVDGDGKPLDEDMIHLKIGHSCVHYIDVVMPVAILTGFLAETVDDAYREPWQRAAHAIWSPDYARELADRVTDYHEKKTELDEYSAH